MARVAKGPMCDNDKRPDAESHPGVKIERSWAIPRRSLKASRVIDRPGKVSASANFMSLSVARPSGRLADKTGARRCIRQRPRLTRRGTVPA